MPAITLDVLRRHIADRTLAPVYLLHGDDVRLMDAMVDAIESTIDPADRPFAAERLHAGDPGSAPIDIAAAARVFPMLGDRRLVVVLRAERLLKPARVARPAGDADETSEGSDDVGPPDLAPLEAYLEAPSPTTTLLFVAAGIDRSRRITKRLLETGQTVECAGLSSHNAAERREVRQDAAELVRRELAASGRTIDAPAVHLLLDRAGADISKLRGDLERLRLYTEGAPRITRADVEEVVAAESEVDDWALIAAIGDGDGARALREAGARLDRGDSPHALVGQLRWWVSQRLAAAAPERVKPALEALLRTDLALKSSGGDDRVLVERLVAELTGRPIPRPAWEPGRR